MNYFLDTETNGFGGAILSLALVSEAGNALYLARTQDELRSIRLKDWVVGHVLPVMDVPGATPEYCSLEEWSDRLYGYLKQDPTPTIIADWPDDIRLLMECFTVRPGEMIGLKNFTCICEPVVSYPTRLEGAVRHNALWDARALQDIIENPPQSHSA